MCSAGCGNDVEYATCTKCDEKANAALLERAESAEAKLNSITGMERTRLAEINFKAGFDKGVEFQKKAAPPPKAKQYRDALKAALDALREAHVEIPAPAMTLLMQGTASEMRAAQEVVRRKAAIALAEGLLR